MNQNYSWGNIAFAVFLGLFVVAMIVAALGYGVKARAIPLLVGGFTLAMILITVLCEFSPRLKKRFDVGLIDYGKIDGLRQEGRSTSKFSTSDLWKKILVAFGWTAGTLLAIYLIGFHLAISLFGIFFLKFHAKVSWLRSIALTGILYGCVYLFFVVLLSVDLYEGVFFGGLPPSF